MPQSVLTLEIATKDRPEEKSLLPMSIVAFSRVIDFPVLSSHLAVTGTIGIQEGSIPSHPGVGGPSKL
jgi:hypothetical protein